MKNLRTPDFFPFPLSIERGAYQIANIEYQRTYPFPRRVENWHRHLELYYRVAKSETTGNARGAWHAGHRAGRIAGPPRRSPAPQKREAVRVGGKTKRGWKSSVHNKHALYCITRRASCDDCTDRLHRESLPSSPPCVLPARKALVGWTNKAR